MLGAGQLLDNATVSGRVNPQAGATITFSLYGPNDATCTGAAVFTLDRGLSRRRRLGPVGGVHADRRPARTAGSPSYSGDANNLPVTGACNDANETRVVSPAQPTITTNASPDIVLGAGHADSTTRR